MKILYKILTLVAGLGRPQKQALLVATDAILAPVSLVCAHYLLFASPAAPDLQMPFFLLLATITYAAVLGSRVLRIHRIKLNAYESTAILRTAVFAVLLVLVYGGLMLVSGGRVQLAALILFGLLFFLSSVASRAAMLQLLMLVLRHGQTRTRVVIYGAGTTGMQLAAALKMHDAIVPVAFADDNESLQALTVAGLPVYSPKILPRLSESGAIDRVLLAMPSLSAPKLNQIARRLQQRGLEVMSVPSFGQLTGTEAIVDALTRVVPGQFLGREHLAGELESGEEFFRGRNVLVSGAGGSIGSELCRQLLSCNLRKLVLFEISEIALYNIDRELRGLELPEGLEIVAVLGSVTDARLVRAVMAQHSIEVVFHAAAYKHVPLVEANPLAGMVNNVLGTRTLADAAQEAGVASFILISTDKAVRPTNVMGASKRLAELVVQDLAKRSSGTMFSAVRFGNVLGSSGSVIPLFKEQIERGGPVTLTHDDITRYFMTIAEAARLVLLAGSYSQGKGRHGCDVFVLDMGRPVRIRELAERMIASAGYSVKDAANPEGDIEIVTIGLRPGEKLFEELLIGEGMLTTPHPKILRAEENSLSELEVATALRALREAVAAGDADAVRVIASRWVEGYAPQTIQEPSRYEG